MHGVKSCKNILITIHKYVNIKPVATKTTNNTSDDFRNLVKGLETSIVQFHSYQLKSNKAYKIVLRDLHHTTDVDDIKKELGELDHNIRNIINIRHWHTEKPCPYFL